MLWENLDIITALCLWVSTRKRRATDAYLIKTMWPDVEIWNTVSHWGHIFVVGGEQQLH